MTTVGKPSKWMELVTVARITLNRIALPAPGAAGCFSLCAERACGLGGGHAAGNTRGQAAHGADCLQGKARGLDW